MLINLSLLNNVIHGNCWFLLDGEGGVGAGNNAVCYSVLIGSCFCYTSLVDRQAVCHHAHVEHGSKQLLYYAFIINLRFN